MGWAGWKADAAMAAARRTVASGPLGVDPAQTDPGAIATPAGRTRAGMRTVRPVAEALAGRMGSHRQ